MPKDSSWSEREAQDYLDRKAAEIESRIISKYNRSLDESHARLGDATQAVDQTSARVVRISIAVTLLVLALGGASYASYLQGRSMNKKTQAAVQDLREEIDNERTAIQILVKKQIEKVQEQHKTIHEQGLLIKAQDEKVNEIGKTLMNFEATMNRLVKQLNVDATDLESRLTKLKSDIRKIESDIDKTQKRLESMQTTDGENQPTERTPPPEESRPGREPRTE